VAKLCQKIGSIAVVSLTMMLRARTLPFLEAKSAFTDK
jgi:hypothetical protein